MNIKEMFVRWVKSHPNACIIAGSAISAVLVAIICLVVMNNSKKDPSLFDDSPMHAASDPAPEFADNTFKVTFEPESYGEPDEDTEVDITIDDDVLALEIQRPSDGTVTTVADLFVNEDNDYTHIETFGEGTQAQISLQTLTSAQMVNIAALDCVETVDLLPPLCITVEISSSDIPAELKKELDKEDALCRASVNIYEDLRDSANTPGLDLPYAILVTNNGTLLDYYGTTYKEATLGMFSEEDPYDGQY